MYGIELEPFAVKLARVTLWMGHKLAVEELALDEPVLPLEHLSQIRRADALKVEWPNADAIIGNPPYHGDRRLRGLLGNDYVQWLEREFGIGLKDYCVYWFRKAHQCLAAGGRAGLVATNSISQNRNRGPSLEWIAQHGGVITNAVSKQPWSGEAVVNVSIINWVKEPPQRPGRFVLDGHEVEAITPALRAPSSDVLGAVALPANRNRCFYGPIPAGEGFIVDTEEAEELLSRPEASYRDVVRPYLVGLDITTNPEQRPTRFIIDFGLRSLEQAMRYPAALEIVRERVRPQREKTRRKTYRLNWWRFAEPLVGMRAALEKLSRYIASNTQGKRILFCWVDPWTCPSSLTTVFAFDDDYSMGVLASTIHHEWARAQSSTLRIDIRYTPTTAFETFPWPQPTEAQRRQIAESTRAMIGRRSTICREREIGLTKLYNEVEEGAYRDLRDLRRQLDEAVAAAYGWPKSVAEDINQSNRRLLELNEEIAAGKKPYEPF